MNQPVLEARALTKHFPVHRRGRGLARGAVVHAVDDVTLALDPASITAIVGESGSGKSTLARTLARLVPPTSGEVLLNGTPARGRNRMDTRAPCRWCSRTRSPRSIKCTRSGITWPGR